MIINVLGQTITPFVTAFVASLMLWKDRGFSANPHITSKKAQFQLEEMYLGPTFLLEKRYAFLLNTSFVREAGRGRGRCCCCCCCCATSVRGRLLSLPTTPLLLLTNC